MTPTITGRGNRLHYTRSTAAQIRGLARRNALWFVVSLALTAGAAVSESPPSRSEPSLGQAAATRFDIGVGVSHRITRSPEDWPLLFRQFNVLTPENCMKPAAVQPHEGQWQFEQPDAIVNFAREHSLKIVGHCLVWAKDDRTPAWFFRDGEQLAPAALLLDRMQTHIRSVAGRYKGQVAMWDVVNEALDDGTNYLRPSGWSRACGESFIAQAFEWAHQADPDALLFYNDYNNELPGKRAKMLRLIRSLQAQNIPLHGIGLQGHYELDTIPFEDLEATLQALRELGLKVVISELDIDIIPRARWWADGGRHRDELRQIDPYREGCPPEILQRQAEQYGRLFRLFARYADVIARVSFWNLHDGQSWLNTFPWRRVNHPLLFDRNGQPKPAFTEVLKILQAP